MFFDFHSGSADVTFAQLIGYRDIPGEATRRAAEQLAILGSSKSGEYPIHKGRSTLATRRGIPTLGTEITGRAGCDPEDVAVYERGLRNLIAYLGIVPGWPPRTDQQRTTVEIVAPNGVLRNEPPPFRSRFGG